MAGKKSFERLPSSVKPLIYDLFLTPDLGNFTFRGEEVITLEVSKATQRIELNCLELRIDAVELKLPNNETLIPSCNVSKKDALLILTFSETVAPGTVKLRIKFFGLLNNTMTGFYRSKYIKSDHEEEKYFAMTQFCATDARRCFPCWDEPSIKAYFDITLVVDGDKCALSNMPIERERANADGSRTIKFKRSPKMSTYLVAFVIGNFDYVEDTSSDGVTVRVYTRVGKKELGKFALQVAVRVLPYYKQYFQIAYPLPKLDLIAVSELSPSAMENWGLVTYREAQLLIDEQNSSARTKQRVAIVISHELAHQWFGNLVTMEWWTHLWLNEGYASFVEFLCVSYLFPEYDIWTQFLTQVYRIALDLDTLQSSHPVEVEVTHPSEVNEIFDEISYNKGACVIRMLYRFIGDECFRKGMNLYLTRHQYGNTCTEDLWSALEEASAKPIKTIMPTWTKQTGYPLITVESVAVSQDRLCTVAIRQSKFNGSTGNNDDSPLWHVPLSFSKQSKPDEECAFSVLNEREGKINITEVNPDEWIKLNPGCYGFYRVKYPEELFQKFVPSVKNKTLSPVDRLGLLDDLFTLAQIGEADTTAVLDFMLQMKEEDNYTVWFSIVACLEKIQNLLFETEFNCLFNKYGLELLKSISAKIKYEESANEGHLVTLLRSLVFDSLVRFKDADFINAAQQRFAEHCEGVKIIPADLRLIIYKAVLSKPGTTTFTSLLKLYRETDLQEEKYRILRAFSAITDEHLVENALRFSQSKEVDSSSAVEAITNLASSKIGRNRMWVYLKENWNSMYETYSCGLFLLSRIIKCLTENFTTEEKAEEIEAFFAVNDINGVETKIQQSLERIRLNASWLRRDKDSIKAYLENRFPFETSAACSV